MGMNWTSGLATIAAMAWTVTSAILLCAVFILASWGVRLALWPVNADFVGPICTMVLVFLAMVAFGGCFPGTERFYKSHLMDKINFINRNLGLSFTIPLIMINDGRGLDGSGIGKIIATTVITNMMSWPLVFIMAISWQLLFAGHRSLRRTPWLAQGRDAVGSWFSKRSYETESTEIPKISLGAVGPSPGTPTASSSSEISLPAGQYVPGSFHSSKQGVLGSCGTTLVGSTHSRQKGLTADGLTVSAPSTAPSTPEVTPKTEAVFDLVASPCSNPQLEKPSVSPRTKLFSWTELGGQTKSLVVAQPYLFLVMLIILVVAIPLAESRREDRPLDFSFLVLFWIGTNELQKALRPAGEWTVRRPRLALAANLFATLVNPVLFTTGFMIAYTQVKAHIRNDPGLTDTLAIFASRTSVSSFLSYHAGIHNLPEGRRDWLGAGDVALALLDCGIVAWGFKLYECRRQLLSRAGMAAVLTSACAAVFNVFVSPLIASRGMGLGASEALAFAARSTTLALSRPAMEALDGNMIVNAAVVVSNGIIGQWIYPFLPRLLGVAEDDKDKSGSKRDSNSTADLEPGSPRGCGATDLEGQMSDSQIATSDAGSTDDTVGPIVSAAGVTVGVNGAAMGVAYLYANDASSAPFAALTMTIFGVITVIVTCAGPFPEILKNLVG